MPGQAIVLIRDKQWQVTLATTAWEQASGLGGIPPIPPGTGMLFDLGCDQIITVSTLPMLFPLDIAFVSDSLMVVDRYGKTRREISIAMRTSRLSSGKATLPVERQ